MKMGTGIFLLMFTLFGVSTWAQEENPYHQLWNKADTVVDAGTQPVHFKTQDTETVEVPTGTFEEHAPELLEEVVRYRVNFLDSSNTGMGYRVQIFSASGPNSKSLATEQKGVFMSLYENIPVYVISSMPYFKVRVGDFPSRMKAIGFMEQIKDVFPKSFVVQDEIVLE